MRACHDCRSGASFALCGVDGFIPYSLMDFKHLMGNSPDTAGEVPYDYLVKKKLTVQLTEVIFLLIILGTSTKVKCKFPYDSSEIDPRDLAILNAQ